MPYPKEATNYLAVFAFSVVFGCIILALAWLGKQKDWSAIGNFYTVPDGSKKRAK